jgi:hypothetical protein
MHRIFTEHPQVSEDEIVASVGRGAECDYEEDFFGFSYGFLSDQDNRFDALSVRLSHEKPLVPS